MTLRDLTKAQLYNLVRKGRVRKREYLEAHHTVKTLDGAFDAGYDKGIKDALALCKNGGPIAR